MRAITVRQPYAWAIANGYKLIENRDWSPVVGSTIGELGERIAIHAAKDWHDSFGGEGIGLASRLATLTHAKGGPLPAGVVPPTTPPLGAIVATAKLVRFVTSTANLPREQHGWFTGPWAWVLEDVRRVSPAIPARGQLGLWLLGAELAAQVLGRQEAA